MALQWGLCEVTIIKLHVRKNFLGWAFSMDCTRLTVIYLVICCCAYLNFVLGYYVDDCYMFTILHITHSHSLVATDDFFLMKANKVILFRTRLNARLIRWNGYHDKI